MIHIGCNLCRRIIADDDADAVREGVGPKGRVDICGACMRDAAARVADRLRTLAQRLDPVPPTVRERAMSIRLGNLRPRG
jgi:hypothetical protein